ncbi:DUF1552 domain-containing protein [Armatimonas sp.]|uniref:DUF1552 domain-containing protein n=1 Tax=Armatimonas sp. TaxID=1872638 RepID=UPI00374D9F24
MPTNTPMKNVYISTLRPLSRRHLLRGTGILLGLPLLEAMQPAFARAAAPVPPRRFLGICNNLGLLPEKFFPDATQTGRGYALSPYLEHLKDYRDEFTVLSGVWHPDVDGGHPADNCFLTAAPHPGSGGFRNTISLDQFIAERLGHLTRFPSLTLGVNVQQGARSLSWTGGGVLIPCEEKPSQVFKKLFLRGSDEEIKEQMRRLALGQSIMDSIAEQTRGLQQGIGARDKERLDQYLTGVRDLEKRLAMAAEWETKPKPVVKEKPPLDPADPREYMDKVRLLYDMARLAFETDSTRAITLMLDSVNSPAIQVAGQAISDGYHNLSHHGKTPAKLAQLERIDREHMKLLHQLFGDLKARKEDGESLLDRTMILYGSNLGNANTHVTTNLPVLFAGGGFKHGQHLGFDRERNYPLPNLFVNVLQRFGLEADRFATSTGTLRGLEVA